jgi:hypothetical protein
MPAIFWLEKANTCCAKQAFFRRFHPKIAHSAPRVFVIFPFSLGEKVPVGRMRVAGSGLIGVERFANV